MTDYRKKSGVPARRKARQRALQCLYAIELGGHDIDSALSDEIFSEQQLASNADFVRMLVSKSVEERDALDEHIRRQSENWDIARMALMDRLILRLAICEMLYCPDISPKVTINEALEISKQFSTSKSSQFINGILDAVLKDLSQSGKIFKVGRGAWEPEPDWPND